MPRSGIPARRRRKTPISSDPAASSVEKVEAGCSRPVSVSDRVVVKPAERAGQQTWSLPGPSDQQVGGAASAAVFVVVGGAGC